MTRVAVVGAIATTGIVPVIRTSSPLFALRAADALREGGIDVFEITMTIPDAPSVIESLRRRYAGTAWVGAGSVLDAEMARRCLDAGAQFLVSPGFDPEVVRLGHAADVAAVPGALTATEILAARALGADVIKLFPCSALGGARYLRNLRGPMPNIPFLPTGGVTLETLPDYFSAGAFAVGVGSELVDESLLVSGNDRELTTRARAFVGATRTVRQARKARASYI